MPEKARKKQSFLLIFAAVYAKIHESVNLAVLCRCRRASGKNSGKNAK